MSRMAEIIKDFIEIGHDYIALHQKYADELEANKATKDVPDSAGHNAQNKLSTLNSLFKNGDLPVKPVEDNIPKEVQNVLTMDIPLSEKLDDLKELSNEVDPKNPDKTIKVKKNG